MTTDHLHSPDHPRHLLRPYSRPGLFVTAIGTDVGKTVVTAALAAALRRLHVRVGVCKPVASGCPKHPDKGAPGNLHDDDYLSPDAEFVARAAGLEPDDPGLLPYLSPIRYGAPVSPHVAARLEDRPVDWHRVAAALDYWEENADILLVEGAGGWLVPLDQHDFMVADLAAALRLPVLVVTDAKLGTLNTTLLTVQAIRQRSLAVAGLVINRVPERRDLAMETNLTELPRLCGVPLRAVLPEIPAPSDLTANPPTVPPEFSDLLMDYAQEFAHLARPEE